jgi:hypothetical protein
MSIVEATRAYERWLGQHCPVVRRDLQYKHVRMAVSPFVFLRGTFYRWIQMWSTLCPAAADAPSVVAVGDLHIENFGTWRDTEGRLIWGVNDVDEACTLPYTQDLVRLATSAVLAVRQGHFGISTREVCDAVIEGYRASRERGGRPVVLAERQRWLRRLALNDLRDPVLFWEKLASLRPAHGAIPQATLRSLLPARRLPYTVVRRVAGVGSLGRPRFVALASWGGALVAREAKARLPSAAAWASGREAGVDAMTTLLCRAVRVPDPFFRIGGQWITRRLAPDCSRIELGELPSTRNERKLLRAMGWETANLHLGTPRTSIDADLNGRPRRWLETAATVMADVMEDEWRAWTRAQGAHTRVTPARTGTRRNPLARSSIAR